MSKRRAQKRRTAAQRRSGGLQQPGEATPEVVVEQDIAPAPAAPAAAPQPNDQGDQAPSFGVDGPADLLAFYAGHMQVLSNSASALTRMDTQLAAQTIPLEDLLVSSEAVIEAYWDAVEALGSVMGSLRDQQRAMAG